MDTIAVISDEPALPEALAEELTEYSVIAVAEKEAVAILARGVNLVIAERAFADSLTISENTSLLTFTRPIRLRELLYTIRKRLQAQTPVSNGEMALAGGVSYSPRERVISQGQGTVQAVLTEKESELFTKLLANIDKTLSREQLLTEVWGYSGDVDTHTIETHIYRLRSKLKQVGACYDIASPEEGGYRIEVKKQH